MVSFYWTKFMEVSKETNHSTALFLTNNYTFVSSLLIGQTSVLKVDDVRKLSSLLDLLRGKHITETFNH